jgi:anaerobic ribonucleoside-triphosphate reductase
MSRDLYCNNCKQFVSGDSQGHCEVCGSHSVGLADRLEGLLWRGKRLEFQQEPRSATGTSP